MKIKLHKEKHGANQKPLDLFKSLFSSSLGLGYQSDFELGARGSSFHQCLQQC